MTAQPYEQYEDLRTHDWTRALCLVRWHCPNEYAQAYAQAGMRMHSTDERRVQALYVLNNITHWRGAEAQVARNILKRFARAK